MNENTKIVQAHYDENVENEWTRIANKPEFLLTCRMLTRYINPGQRIIDIGGGPGRYSLHLARKGCDVTLLDLSQGNVKFAEEEAGRQGLTLKTLCGDACEADELAQGPFDHVLLMGPMYHLLEESDRIKAMKSALNLLNPGGVIFVSFINMFANVVFAMRHVPELINSQVPCHMEYLEALAAGKSYAGDGFTRAFFIDQREVLPFMAQFPLEKLHLFGQEGITSPCEINILTQPQEVIDGWLNFSERVWEREEFLSYSEHLMYVGRKRHD